MPSLFVVRGRDQGKHFQLSGGVHRVGRETGSDIQLLDSESSRSHAEIRRDETGRYELVDLGSSNGTKINGARVQRHRLSSGDRIEIGGTLMIYTGAGPHPADGHSSDGIAPIDAAHGVDIVLRGREEDASRIVSSLSQPTSPTLSPSSLSSSSLSPDFSGSPNHAGTFGSTGKLGTPEQFGSSKQVGSSKQFGNSEQAGSSDQFSGSEPARHTDADRSLEVMYLTAIAVGRTDDLDEVLNRILRLVFDWVTADRGCVMLRDVATGRLRAAARCDREASTNSVRGKPIAISQTILDYVLEKKEGVRTSDARDDVRFDAAASIVQGGVREALCVPLQGRYGIVGALYIDTFTSPGQFIAGGSMTRFNDDHLRLITAIGHQAALAIEDTFYYSALVQNERLAAMGQTIATLSHHIKNILQGISGGSYLIEAGLDRGDTDAVRRGWSIVDRNQDRISNLVMDMLTFSKEREPEKVDADLNDTVADVVELMQTRAGEMGVTLASDLEPGMPPASFDPDAIHRAVMNLITNAIDAASGRMNRENGTDETDFDSDDAPTPEPEPGKVDVQTRYVAGEGWMVNVVDNGPGVAPQDREKIFSLFESRKGMRGTGLGLPVSAKIMREHGGEVTIVDRDREYGTCFRLRFPDQGTSLSDLTDRDTMA